MFRDSAVNRLRLLLYTNPISWVGGFLTTLSFMLMVSFFVLNAVGLMRGPYVGAVALLVLPGLFAAGLLLMPLGLLVYRKKIKERVETIRETPGRFFRLIGLLTLVNVAVIGIFGYQGMHYMDSVEFCGELCHTVMQPQLEAYRESPHARVACVQCHIGPGASWFVKSKLSGARQVFAVLFDTYQKPIPTPIHDLRPARDTCEQCHWPDKDQGDRFVVREHHMYDRESTPYRNILVMKTGGVRPDGTAEGIHWHVHEGNRVTYVAADEKRSEIPWVRLENQETGETLIFTAEGVDPDHPPAGEMRTMDCIDCHNQPSHIYERSWQAVDRAMVAGLLPRELPFVKKVVREVVEKPWTRENVTEGIRGELTRFYTEEEPLDPKAKPLLDEAVDAAVRIWERNIHPEMGIVWDTYPSFAGHRGCFRCHDDRHRTAEGKRLAMDCDQCHTVLEFRAEKSSLLEAMGYVETR